jgi:type II secretion system protein N
VRRFFQITGIVAGAVIAVFAIALTGLNLYVQSQGTQAGIQQELSQRLGTPLRFNAVSVTPWGGLTLSGITIPQVVGGSGNFLAAKSFHLHIGIFSLFSGKLLIKKVALLHPTVDWPQNEDGKWRLPGSQKREHSAASPEETPPASPVPSPPAATPQPSAVAEAAASPAVWPATAPPAPPKETHRGLIPDVRKLSVTEGSFHFLDRAGKLVATFDDVDFRANVRNAVGLRGAAAVARMSVRDRFFLERMQSPLRYDPNRLELPKITARAGGGDVSGAFSIQPESQDSPFKVSVKFRNVQADEIVSEAGGPHGVIQGKLEGNFEAAGKASDPNALSGTGEIVLRDGQVQQYSLLVALGQVLQIEELTQLHLEQAQARYHVTPGLVTIDELVLRSPNIRLSATGTITFNGKLRLDSQLAINDKIRGQLYKPIRENFQPINEPGYSAVEFQVNGTLERPKTNLVERVVGRDLKEIVSGLLGGKKSERPKKKKKEAGAAASPAEESSPTVAPSDSSPVADATATPAP